MCLPPGVIHLPTNLLSYAILPGPPQKPDSRRSLALPLWDRFEPVRWTFLKFLLSGLRAAGFVHYPAFPQSVHNNAQMKNPPGRRSPHITPTNYDYLKQIGFVPQITAEPAHLVHPPRWPNRPNEQIREKPRNLSKIELLNNDIHSLSSAFIRVPSRGFVFLSASHAHADVSNPGKFVFSATRSTTPRRSTEQSKYFRVVPLTTDRNTIKIVPIHADRNQGPPDECRNQSSYKGETFPTPEV